MFQKYVETFSCVVQGEHHVWTQHALFQQISQHPQCPISINPIFSDRRETGAPIGPGGHLLWRLQMRCVHTQRHAVLLIIQEWRLRRTRPPRSSSPVSHIYVLPWQLVRNKALKQQEARGHQPWAKLPNKACNPPARGRRFGSAGMGSNMIPDNEPPGACASSCNRCKDSSSWQLTIGAFTGNRIKQMMCSHAEH